MKKIYSKFFKVTFVSVTFMSLIMLPTNNSTALFSQTAEAAVQTNIVSVRTVQRSLNNFRVAFIKAHGFSPFDPLIVDGICGSATNFAIDWFQLDCASLGIISYAEVDAIVGPKTWHLLKIYNY